MSLTRNRLAAVLTAAVAIGGVGAGVALGTSGGSSSPAAASVAAPAAGSTASDTTVTAAPETSAPETSAPETGAAEPAGPDTDNIQEGDQTTPDSPKEKADPAESGTEKADAGGHEDPPGAEVDHQNEGVE